MTPEEARIILSAARPGGLDDADPQVSEALALAGQDPALAEWLKRERALDRAVSLKMRTGLPCPPELNARLLAARRTVRPAAWWRQPAWMAAAACVLALAVVALGAWAAIEWPRHYGDFEAAMLARSAETTNQTMFLARDFSTAANLLAGHGANTNLVLPPGLEGRSLSGSYSFRWKLHRVTAFRFKNAEGKPLDLYVLENPRFNDIPYNCIPDFSAAGDRATAHYYGHLNEYYLLVAPANSGLEKLFPK